MHDTFFLLDPIKEYNLISNLLLSRVKMANMRLFTVIICIGIGIFLQVSLPMKRNKWWGLAIPLVITLQIIYAVANEISHYEGYFPRGGSAPITVFLADFLIAGIVLVPNLIIYWISRIKIKKNN